MAKKTPPFKEHQAWTEARFWGFVRSALRKSWTRWPPRFEVLKQASRPYKGPDKRRKLEYQCEVCKKWFMNKEVQVDHIEPCGTLRTYEDLPAFVKRLFVGVGKLRVLCKSCHTTVTNKQKENGAI